MARQKDNPLKGYEVLLCVTGGIACYKVAHLTSKLVQAAAGVSVAMTEAATRFVAPLTFQTLTGRAVYTSLWESTERYSWRHISLTDAADLMLIAPATANIIAKMATGIADDLVSTLSLAAAGACKILLAPAMNERMWQAPPTKANIEKLNGWGVHIVGPVRGHLACGVQGQGRLAEPDAILAKATELLLSDPPKGHVGA